MRHQNTPPSISTVHSGFRRLALACIVMALAAATGCREPKQTPEEVAYQFRDIFPYPAITGGGDDTTRMQPLQDGYFIYIKGEDFNAAAAEFERVWKAHSDLPEARLLQGFSLVLADRPKDAIPVLEAVTAESPGYAPGQWFLAQAYFSAGRREDALKRMRIVASLGSLYADQAKKVLKAAGE